MSDLSPDSKIERTPSQGEPQREPSKESVQLPPVDRDAVDRDAGILERGTDALKAAAHAAIQLRAAYVFSSHVQDERITPEQIEKTLEMSFNRDSGDGLEVKKFLNNSYPMEEVTGLKVLLNMTPGIGTMDETRFGGAPGVPLDTNSKEIDAPTIQALFRFKGKIENDPGFKGRNRPDGVTELDVQNYLGERVKMIEEAAIRYAEATTAGATPGQLGMEVSHPALQEGKVSSHPDYKRLWKETQSARWAGESGTSLQHWGVPK